MSISQQLWPPQYWQELEKLCWDLWSAIWSDPRALRVGRLGQNQNGVDIAGRSGQDTDWEGIQCKSKDNLCQTRITVQELEEEVEKAKHFQPKLKHFMVVTTGPKDATVEERAREITQVNIAESLFSVTVLAWPDVLDRLEQHPEVRDRNYPAAADPPVTDCGHLAHISARLDEIALGLSPQDDALSEALKSEHQAEIDHARQLLNSNNPRQAKRYLQELKDRVWDTCDELAKYRILANLGFACVRTGEPSQAAAAWHEALKYSKDNAKALSYAALGSLLIKDTDRALALTEQALSSDPQSTDALYVKLHLHKSAALPDIIAIIPEQLRHDPHLASAIGYIAQEKEEYAQSIAWYRTALAADPGRTEVRGFLGGAILQSVLDKQRIGHQPLANSDREALTETIAHLTHAWDEVKETDARHSFPEWLANRAVARALLGRLHESASDWERAIEISGNRAVFVNGLALLAMQMEDPRKALELFKRVEDSAECPQAALLIAQCLSQLDGIPAAIEQFQRVVKTHPDPTTRKHAAHALVQVYLETDQRTQAETANAEMLQADPSDILAIIDSVRIARAAGDISSAQQRVTAAAAHVTSDTPAPDIMFLAEEAYGMEQFNQTIKLAELISDVSTDNRVSRLLLNSYHRTGALNKCLALCRSILTGSGPLKYVSTMAATICEQIGDTEEAKSLYEAAHAQDPNDTELRLRLAWSRIQTGTADNTSDLLAPLPPSAELSYDEAMLLTHIHVGCGDLDAALMVLYQLRRKYYAKPEAHLFYVAFVLQHEKELDPLLARDVVDPGSAVRLKEPSGGDKWYILEEDNNADIARGELAPSHKFSGKLTGLHAGDTATLIESPFGDQTMTVQEVVSKYVYALRESMSQYQSMFPERTELIQLNLGGPDVAPEEAVNQLLKVVRQRSDQISQVESMYQDGPVTIGAFARMCGKSPIETHGYLSSKPALGIRCSEGSRQELEAALASLKTAGTPVAIDLTALITLERLGLVDLIASDGRPLLVSQSSLEEIRKLKTTCSGLPSKGYLSLAYEDDHPIKVEITKQQVQEQIAWLESLEEIVTTHCQTLPCLTAPPDERPREEYAEILGASFADTVFLAIEHGAMLYTDDVRLRALARNEWQVGGFWTQPLLIHFRDETSISKERYVGAVIQLATLNYRHLGIDSEVLLTAIRQSNWRVDSPFSHVVRLLGGRSCSTDSATTVAAHFLVQLWQAKVVSPEKDYIVIELIEALAAFRDQDKVLDALVHKLSILLNLAPTVLSDFEATIAAWKKAKRQRF